MLLLLAGPARADEDLRGDTFGKGPVQQDITTYNAITGGGQTTFSIDFANNIAAPSASAPNSLVGYINLDLDNNPNTGGNAPWGQNLQGGNNWINYFISPNPGLPSIPADMFNNNTLIALGMSTSSISSARLITRGWSTSSPRSTTRSSRRSRSSTRRKG
jgi:hypothetical protein